MKKFLKRLIKGLGIAVALVLICMVVNLIVDAIYAFSPILYVIVCVAILLLYGYHMAKE